MHAHIPAGTLVAVIEIWIALNVMVVLALVAPSRRLAKFYSLSVFTLSWMAVCGALRFLPR
jgi:hypothetical protein